MSRHDRPRFSTSVDRLIIVGVLALLGIAACAALDDSSDAPDEATESAPAIAVTFPASTTTISPATSTTSSTTTTAAPTTTIAPTVEVVTEVCESLRSDGLETRRVMVDALAEAFSEAGGAGDGRAEVAAECGDALDRLSGAVGIRDRMQAIDIAEEDDVFAMSLTDFSCDAGTFQVTVTNDTSTPLGLHANFAMYIDGDRENAVQSSFAPIAIWSLEPGASEVITGRFTDSPEAQIFCNFEAQLFDADPSPADASLSDEPDYPELTGDDPAAWFPALYEFERAARTSGDIDLAAAFVDVRAMSYDETALVISEGEELSDAELVEVCERGRSQPDDDHIGFVYLERLASGQNQLSHGLFRRGGDGQWRWLGFARYYESSLGSDCFTVDPE